MDVPKKLTSQQQKQEQQEATAEQQNQASQAREFASVEEMLRHDALHTPVPPSVAERLSESIANEAPPAKPWWRRWLNSK